MKPSLKKPFIIILSGGGLLTLLLLYLHWLKESQGYHMLEQAAALLSLILFAAVGLRVVPAWASFWCAEEQSPSISKPDDDRVSGWKVFLLLLGWDAAVLLLAWPLRMLVSGQMSLAQSMREWVCGDGIHYLDIARDWYLSTGSIDRVVQLVFLPGYPIAIRLAHLLIPNWTYAALAVSGLCFAGAGTLLYRLMALDLERDAALRCVIVLCLLPGSFFFAAAMSESLFLLCCVGCLYWARKEKWLPACLVGAYAAFTRSLGITLLVPLVMELVHDRVRNTRSKSQKIVSLLSLLFVPMGFGAYLLVNYQVSGNPFQFLIYQSEHWHQNFGLFFNTAASQMDYAVSAFHNEPDYFLGLWLPNLIASFAGLAVMLYGARRVRGSYSVWFLPYYFIAIGATWLLSAPRYLLVFFPISESIALMTEKKSARALIFILLGIAAMLYFLAFLERWQVF